MNYLRNLALFAVMLLPALLVAGTSCPKTISSVTIGNTPRRTNFSPDGSLLAVTSDDHILRIYTVKQGVATLKSSSAVWPEMNGSMVFSPDSKQIFITGNDWTVRCFDVATGAFTYSIKPQGNVYAMAFSPDGKSLAISTTTEVKIFNMSTGAFTVLTDLEHGEIVYSMAYTSEGDRLLCGTSEGSVKLWNIASQSVIRKFNGSSTNGIDEVVLTKDKRFVLGSSFNAEIVLWDYQTGAVKYSFSLSSKWIHGLEILPGEKSFVTSQDGVIEIWDMNDGHKLHQIACQGTLFSIHPSGLYMARNTMSFGFSINNFSAYASHQTAVDYLVNSQLQGWMIKGEFEKTADYQQRTSEAGVEKKKQSLTLTAKVEVVNLVFSGQDPFSFTLSTYDADAEAYTMNCGATGIFSIAVPIADAPAFKSHWATASFGPGDYLMNENGQFEFMSMAVYDPVTKKTYKATKKTS